MANKPGEANFFPDVPVYPEMGTFQPVYGKFDLTTYIQGASDYEIMAFLVGKYNACLEAYGTATKLSTDTITAAHQLQDWINSWFTNLDVQQELNNKIDSMVQDGSFGLLMHHTFDTQINQQTTSAVTAWLVANVTPTGSAVVVDKSLSIEGAAADAKETGELKKGLDEVTDMAIHGSVLIPLDGVYKRGAINGITGVASFYDSSPAIINTTYQQFKGKTITINDGYIAAKYSYVLNNGDYNFINVSELYNGETFSNDDEHYYLIKFEKRDGSIIEDNGWINIGTTETIYKKRIIDSLQPIASCDDISKNKMINVSKSSQITNYSSNENNISFSVSGGGYIMFDDIILKSGHKYIIHGNIKNATDDINTSVVFKSANIATNNWNAAWNPYGLTHGLFSTNIGYRNNRSIVVNPTMDCRLAVDYNHTDTNDLVIEIYVIDVTNIDESVYPYFEFYNNEYGVINAYYKDIPLWDNKIIAFLGDSLTAQRKLPMYSADNLNLNYAQNVGLGGSTIAVISGRANSFCERYTQITSDADAIVILGGTNDKGQNVPIGTNESTDNTTFKGAISWLVNAIYTRYPNTPIVFATPPYEDINTRTYVNAMKEVCEYLGVPVIDTYNLCGINAYNKTTLLSDGTHPTAYGYKRMARVISDNLKMIEPR